MPRNLHEHDPVYPESGKEREKKREISRDVYIYIIIHSRFGAEISGLNALIESAIVLARAPILRGYVDYRASLRERATWDLHLHSTSRVIASWKDLPNSLFFASQVYTSPFMSSVRSNASSTDDR